MLVRLDECPLRARVADEQALELVVAQELHRTHEVRAQCLGQPSRELGEVTLRHKHLEHVPGLARHRLVDSLETLHEAADVVVAIPVAPNVLDNLLNGASGRGRFLGSDAGGILEVGEEGSVEAVEHGEVVLVGVPLALARPTAQHLLEQDAALHRPQEDDELQVRDVHARGQKIDCDRDAGIV